MKVNVPPVHPSTRLRTGPLCRSFEKQRLVDPPPARAKPVVSKACTEPCRSVETTSVSRSNPFEWTRILFPVISTGGSLRELERRYLLSNGNQLSYTTRYLTISQIITNYLLTTIFLYFSLSPPQNPLVFLIIRANIVFVRLTRRAAHLAQQV
jgi:hypothetical protein